VSPEAQERRARHRFGLWAETAATLLLSLKGYRILARRFAVRGGEVDVIAQRGDTIAFVEVKARADMEAASIAITPQKERRIRIAAARWLAANPRAAGLTLRADAIFIATWRWPRHVENAMELRIG
jgi:putative endonuclease